MRSRCPQPLPTSHRRRRTGPLLAVALAAVLVGTGGALAVNQLADTADAAEAAEALPAPANKESWATATPCTSAT
jgi:hypothetical protein